MDNGGAVPDGKQPPPPPPQGSSNTYRVREGTQDAEPLLVRRKLTPGDIVSDQSNMDSSSDSCPPSPTFQAMCTFQRCADDFLTHAVSARDGMRLIKRKYRDRQRVWYAEIKAMKATINQLHKELSEEREISLAQFEDELRLKRKRSARIAQLEELRIEREKNTRVPQLEEELRLQKHESDTLRTQLGVSQRRFREAAIIEGKRETELCVALVEQERLTGEVVQLHETLSRQTAKEVETPAHLVIRARQTDEYQIEVTNAFAMGNDSWEERDPQVCDRGRFYQCS